MKIYVSPHSLDSEGSKLLAEKLNAKRINPGPESKYKYKPDHLVINWGSSAKKPWFVKGSKILNSPENVEIAVDKIKSLTKLQAAGVSVPEFSTNIEDAKQWIKNGNIVVCRTKIKGSGGNGIVISHTEKELVPAPLYTAYKKKKAEYRIAVVGGEVIDYMQKKKRLDWKVEEKGEINNYIRSWDNGWIFARENVVPPACVLDSAIKATKALNLDFASVDIIYNENEKKCYVLELNSAPGLEPEGTSLERYSKAFLELSNNQAVKGMDLNQLLVEPEVPKINNPPVVAAPAPAAVKNVPKNKENNKFKLEGITNIEIRQIGENIAIYGKVVGVPHLVRIMELENPNLKYWWGD